MNFHCIYNGLESDCMVYGIVSEKDNETTRTVFRSKKIADTDIYPVTKLDLLVSRLNFGDTIIFISVDRFLSVSQYVVFSEKVLNAGVSLRIMEQPYLDIGNGKHWRSSVVSHLHTLVQAENVTVNRLYSVLELTDKGKYYVSRCVTDMSIGILAKTYSVDGILRRGN